jgi:MYXO-CTERM domain-containing protein
MKLERIVWYAAVLLLCVGPATARAQYLLTGGGGAQIQIGGQIPLPIGSAGVFLGGMTPNNGGTSCGMGVGGCSVSPDGPGTPYWPPLLVKPNTDISTGGAWTRTIQQNHATPKGGTIVVPPRALSRPARGAPVPIGIFPEKPAVFQVATTISYAWPAATATLAPGGAPGPAVFGTSSAGPVITYSGGTKAFGGPARFAFSPGPGAGIGRVPPNASGVRPVLTAWINVFGAFPTSATRVGIVGESTRGLPLPGAALTSPLVSATFGSVASGFGFVNGSLVPPPTGPIPCPPACPVGPQGTIDSSLPIPSPLASNRVYRAKGFPWTTGLITISAPSAVPGEIFWLSGTDMRVQGVGNVSLVSGGVAVRQLTGPSADRAWLRLTLPEPEPALGTAAALAALAVCHACVRRRRARPT